MDRAEALKTAVEHVKALSTNERGYRRDGLTLTQQAEAIERFAAFLVGPDPADEPVTYPGDIPARVPDDGDGYLRKDMP